MAFRTYLQIPYSRHEEAKDFCKAQNLLRLVFDGRRTKRWFYPSDAVPPALSARFPVIEVVEVDQDGNHLRVLPQEAPEIFTHKPTEEQLEFVATEPAGPENLLVVRAFAGAAKTTSLRAYTRARPQARFLYLAFGHANAKEARETFPPNTVCSTVHALAHRWLSPELKRKVANDLKTDAICDLLGWDKNFNQDLATATYVRKLLFAFWSSADPYPGAHHFDGDSERLAGAAWTLGAEALERITAGARAIWDGAQNPDHPAPLIHEAYLKLYALAKPIWDEFDYILLDEAQDTNPVTEDLVFSQPAKKIIVGDPHQNVYTFRRARDILSPRMESGCPTLHLSTSFRFGPQVADVANVILRSFKEERYPVIGRGNEAKVFAPGGVDWRLKRDGSFQPFTWITRSNPDLFAAAVEVLSVCEAYEAVTGKPGPKIAFIGTSERFGFSPFQAYKFGRLLDLVHLAAEERSRIHDPYIGLFKSIEHLQNVVSDSSTMDQEMLAALRIYRRYKRALPSLIRRIGLRCVGPDDPRAWVRFTTAHKSKGLEWPRVRLGEDFKSIGKLRSVEHYGISGKSTTMEAFGPSESFAQEEYNLMYVAITRAQRELELNRSIAAYLLYTQNVNMLSDVMPGMAYCREPWDWDRAVASFGGNPAALRAKLAEERAKARASAEEQSQTT